MTQREQLDKMQAAQGGYLQTAQAVAAGITKPVFYKYVQETGMGQVAHGIFAAADIWPDPMYLLHLRCAQAVFSHETALFFHDLTDREPAPYSVTVKTGYNPSRLKADGFAVYTVKQELHEIGLTTTQTPLGHTVPVYDMERTVCDMIRSRNGMEAQSFLEALKQYSRRRDKDLQKLMQDAKLFHVDKILRQYLEVLL